mgnify:CR=1 FL=1
MDRAIQTALIPDNSGIFHIRSNNLAILNKHFKKKDCWKKNWKKYLSIRYGADLYRNIALLPWSNWTGFYDDHLPASYLKSSFEKIWSLEEEFLSKASGCRFRSRDDYSEWLMRYYQYAKGLFTPCAKRGKFFDLESIADVQYASEQILQNTMKMACFNDSLKNESFEDAKSLLNASLEKLFPKKSEFEK